MRIFALSLLGSGAHPLYGCTLRFNFRPRGGFRGVDVQPALWHLHLTGGEREDDHKRHATAEQKKIVFSYGGRVHPILNHRALPFRAATARMQS
ncbi:hypothetical protein F5884DRAFT_272325 [Xylogone sp. PMI_703]|nr:hypothetical protein F5884DRAFT_272325 [Xylogone sp. PMI_703]